MTTKPVILRQAAVDDVDSTITTYLTNSDQDTALRFVEALEATYAHISAYPGSGSSRYAHELSLPGLQSWPVTGFPYLVFAVERSDHIDIWRVLHMRRDIPAAL